METRKDLLHRRMRDTTHGFARRGGLRPAREKVGLLEEFREPSGRRPADTLLCGALGPGFPAQAAGAPAVEKHALDFFVVNPLGLSHAAGAAPEPLAAAEEYAEQKRNFRGTADKCRAVGIEFLPVGFEATGGIEARTAAPTPHRIAAAVAAAEGREVGDAKAELLQRLSMELVRGAARAVLRRAPRRWPGGGGGGAKRFLRGEGRLPAPGEEVPEE